MHNYNWKFFVLVVFLVFCFIVLPRGSAVSQFIYSSDFTSLPTIYNYSNTTGVSNYNLSLSGNYAYVYAVNMGMGSSYISHYGAQGQGYMGGMGSGYIMQYDLQDSNYGMMGMLGMYGMQKYGSGYGTQDYGYVGMGSRLNFGNVFSTQMAAPSIITNTTALPTRFFTVPTPIVTAPNRVGFVSIRGTEKFEVEVKPPPPPDPYPYTLLDIYPAPYPYSYLK